MKTLSSHQVIEFLSLLLQEVRPEPSESTSGLLSPLTFDPFVPQDPLPLTHVKKMQEVYHLNTCTNSEIRFR